jgi:thiamine biosynthesis protein ThiS
MIKVNGREFPWKEGMTVADLLRLLKEESLYSIVRIGGKIVTEPDFEKTVIPNSSEVFLISLLAGG